jgi:anti-anti-sigma regulatory factor
MGYAPEEPGGGMLKIDIRPSATGTCLAIQGVIDECASFGPFGGLSGRVEIDLKGVRRINSFGARAWMDAIRELAQKARLSFVGCSPQVVDQLNMISGFLAGGSVVSFYAPMRCDGCDTEDLVLVTADACRNHDGFLPAVKCAGCGQRMYLDDVEDQYTLFLREPTRIR